MYEAGVLCCWTSTCLYVCGLFCCACHVAVADKNTQVQSSIDRTDFYNNTEERQYEIRNVPATPIYPIFGDNFKYIRDKRSQDSQRKFDVKEIEEAIEKIFGRKIENLLKNGRAKNATRNIKMNKQNKRSKVARNKHLFQINEADIDNYLLFPNHKQTGEAETKPIPIANDIKDDYFNYLDNYVEDNPIPTLKSTDSLEHLTTTLKLIDSEESKDNELINTSKLIDSEDSKGNELITTPKLINADESKENGLITTLKLIDSEESKEDLITMGTWSIIYDTKDDDETTTAKLTKLRDTTNELTTTPSDAYETTTEDLKEPFFRAKTTKAVNLTNATESTTTTVKTATMDVLAILNMISNLTDQYSTNLTKEINETLLNLNSLPTCPVATIEPDNDTTTDIPTTDESQYGAIIAKCFFCGMDIPGIPVKAACADAFAGDFLPLVPIDPSARGEIARYRKYCRYADVNNYQHLEDDPRSVFGRWTGGCSARWVDLSGVYTQRSCRDRRRASLGQHFVSKRMAKLEMTLRRVENGCVVSPMATLVPFSRGISLYARFHACVCTGNWCNSALWMQPCIANIVYSVIVFAVV